jgi:hypothetical protein
MDSDKLNYIFKNTKNIISDTKKIFKNILLTKNEKKIYINFYIIC